MYGMYGMVWHKFRLFLSKSVLELIPTMVEHRKHMRAKFVSAPDQTSVISD